MKIIFIKDVKKQGKKDEIKEVKDGFAKYLINEGSAVAYTSASIHVLNRELEERKQNEINLVNECNKIKKSLNDKTLTFKVKTGTNDKVFGSITSKQISDEFKTMGYDVDKKKINLNEDINTLGVHKVKVTLHKDVVFNINVNLVK